MPTKAEFVPFRRAGLPIEPQIREHSRFDRLLKKFPLRAARGLKSVGGKSMAGTLPEGQLYQNTDDFRTCLFHLMKRTDTHANF